MPLRQFEWNIEQQEMASKGSQFLMSVLVLGLVGQATVAIMTPPDPLTQLYTVGALVPVVLVLSYHLSYQRGYEWI